MNRRVLAAIAGGVIAIVLAFVAYDLAVVSDEERIEQFVEETTGTVTSARVQNARARWVDLSRQRMNASVYGQAIEFREGDDARLAQEASTRLRDIEGSHTRTLGSEIEIDGERATVTLRVLSDRLGLANVEWYLEKHDGDWLVSRLVVRRGSVNPLARDPARR